MLHYRILRRLGAGMMGVVYAAEDGKLGRVVALKFLPDDLAADPKALARLKREATAVSKLDHPNVGTLFALESTGTQSFLVMAFYDGETLEERLHRDPPLSVPEVQRIVLEIAKGLGHAHLHGVVHRDVKPSNVILANQPDGHAVTKLLDFGLARLQESATQLTRPGSTTGTPLYMPPEQVRGGAVSSQADIWAWGVLTYQLLSSHTPFEGSNLVAVMMNIMQNEAVPLEMYRSDAPPALLEAVGGALKKPLEERWQGMAQVIALLEGSSPVLTVNALEPVTAPTPAAITPEPRPAPSVLAALTHSDWVSSDAVVDASRATAQPSAPLAPASPRPAWLWPLIGGVALVGIAAIALTAFNAAPVAPACQPWSRSSERMALTDSGALEWQRGSQAILGTPSAGSVALTDCGAFFYGAVSDAKALYAGATRATRQVIAWSGLVLSADRTEGVKRASLEFPQVLTPTDNANSDGQEFYSSDQRFVYTALEPTVPGVKYGWRNKTLEWSFYDYKLQPTQVFLNAAQTLEVDEGAEFTYPTGLPDDGSLTGVIVTRGNERTAVFFNFAGPSLEFMDVNVPPGIKQYLITNLRPGARYDLSFAPERNWWSVTLTAGGRYAVSSSGVLLLTAQPPKQ